MDDTHLVLLVLRQHWPGFFSVTNCLRIFGAKCGGEGRWKKHEERKQVTVHMPPKAQKHTRQPLVRPATQGTLPACFHIPKLGPIYTATFLPCPFSHRIDNFPSNF